MSEDKDEEVSRLWKKETWGGNRVGAQEPEPSSTDVMGSWCLSRDDDTAMLFSYMVQFYKITQIQRVAFSATWSFSHVNIQSAILRGSVHVFELMFNSRINAMNWNNVF